MKSSTANQQLVAKIKSSSLFQSYQQAFQTLTGLPLTVQAKMRLGSLAYDSSSPQNRFCRLLNQGRDCRGCSHTHVNLLRSSTGQVESCQCFAGLRETAVPVKQGEETIAFLRTGQVLSEPPKVGDFAKVAVNLKKEGFTDGELDELQAAFEESKVVKEREHKEIEMLLAIFSLQLTNLVNQLVLQKASEEPDVASNAKRYIRENLSENLTLNSVADAVGVSSFYFCKVFKQATQMTFTEYVNRKRVEWAKKALMQPYSKVTEIAFEVGYQSLSQFNRSFLKYSGESPSKFRKRMSDANGRDLSLIAS